MTNVVKRAAPPTSTTSGVVKSAVPATPTMVGEALHAALWAMRTQNTKALSEVGATGPQTGVLWFLHEYEALSLAKLAEMQGTTPANMTGMVKRLERDGLVTRRGHPSDNRVKLIALTPEGLAMTKQARHALDKSMALFFQGTAQSELDVVLRVLTQVKQRGEPGNASASGAPARLGMAVK